MDPKDYTGREQTYVKHYVLKHYLQSLAFKVGQFQPGTTLNYIDGFSGPWMSTSAGQRDSSPSIAMSELAKVCDDLARLPKPTKMSARCLFVEEDAQAFAQLEQLCRSVSSVTTLALQGQFESHIKEAVQFAGTGPQPFAFVFIDPTGWSGYSLATISPLLQVQPCEVLINFMVQHISRFIDDDTPSTLASFEALFGQSPSQYRARWQGLKGMDREDAIVAAYQERIRAAGRYSYCVSALVLNPLSDRTHFRLIYATRSRHGLTTFRETERRALNEQDVLRATAKQSKRVSHGGQGELFGAEEVDTPYADQLKERYARQAQRAVLDALEPVGSAISYDDLVDVALIWPMVCEADLKNWLVDWKRDGLIALIGLKERERTPKLDSSHQVRKLRPSPSSKGSA